MKKYDFSYPILLKIADDKKSADALLEPLTEYSVPSVYDKARAWFSPEDMIEQLSEDGTLSGEPLMNTRWKALRALQRGDTSLFMTEFDKRTVPQVKRKVLFGLLPDEVESDLSKAIVDDSGTQKLRKSETSFLRDMWQTGTDEDRKEIKRLLKTYLFKNDLDDLINGDKSMKKRAFSYPRSIKMTLYEKGFLAKCAEHGVDGRILVKSAKEKFLNTYAGRTSVSAGAGALVGLLYEALKKKQQKKYWLKSILNGALGGAAAGAGSLAFRRNMLEPTMKIDASNTKPQEKPGEESWRKRQAEENKWVAEQAAKRAPAIKAWNDALRQVMGDKAFNDHFPNGPVASTTILPSGVDAEAVKALMPEEHRHIW